MTRLRQLFGSALNAQQQLLSREATITRKSAQLARARTALSRTRLERDQNERDLQALNENQQARIKIEIRQLEQDIKNLEADIRDTEIASPSDGQIGFLAALQRGFSREGDVIARIIDPDDFEIEAEIPVEYMGFLMQAKQIRGRDLQGNLMSLKPRAVLPVQNARTGTQTVRFAAKEGLPKQVTAENAVIVIKVPTTSPAPVVVVPKDAVLPVPGGHVVYVAADGVAKKTAIQLGDAVGENFVVMSGLAAGVDVIIRGNEALTDGKKIKIGGELHNRSPRHRRERHGPLTGQPSVGLHRQIWSSVRRNPLLMMKKLPLSGLATVSISSANYICLLVRWNSIFRVRLMAMK